MWKGSIAVAALALAATAQAELITDGGFDDSTTAAWEFQIYDTSTIA